MKWLVNIFFLVMMLFISSSAVNISKKYDAYRYVFDEFDVPKSYIYNDDFVSFVKKNEKMLKGFYRRSLKRGKSLLPTMKGLLVGEGVSDLFLYLSMVESGFIQDAKSSKKAVGLWQFMPATARQYNLTVCNSYDERCDTVSATNAAINYLNKLHRQFGKWYIAAMAYNCGEGCVERAIRRAGSDDIAILTNDRLKILPKETRDYIRKILLVAMIGESQKGSADIMAMPTENEVIEVEVDAGTSLKNLAKLIHIKFSLLKKLNRKIKNEKLPNTKPKYKIKIPLDKIYAFYLRYEIREIDKPKKSHLLSYIVKMGDTLKSIAIIYRANVAEIIEANSLMDSYLEVGQFLVIPVTQNVFENAIPK